MTALRSDLLGGWHAPAAMEERDLPASIQRDLFDKIAFSFPESEMALAMPVPGHGDDTRPGHRRYYFIWYRPADAAALRDPLHRRQRRASPDVDPAAAHPRRRAEIVAHGRKLGTRLDGVKKPPDEWTGADAYRDPKRVLKDYGAPHLVHDLTARDLVA